MFSCEEVFKHVNSFEINLPEDEPTYMKELHLTKIRMYIIICSYHHNPIKGYKSLCIQ